MNILLKIEEKESEEKEKDNLKVKDEEEEEDQEVKERKEKNSSQLSKLKNQLKQHHLDPLYHYSIYTSQLIILIYYIQIRSMQKTFTIESMDTYFNDYVPCN